MFFKYTVPVPAAVGKISRQKTKSGTYILYVISRQYDPAKKHTVPVRAMIGKVSDEEGMMFPNEKFFEYFPETPIRCHTNFRHPFNLSWSGKTCDIRRSSKTTS